MDWAGFAVATATVGGVLLGALLLVAGLRIDRVAQQVRAAGRLVLAAATLGGPVVASLFVLTPGQTDVALGIEVAVLGLVLAIVSVVGTGQLPVAGEGEPAPVLGLVTALVPAACLVLAGLTLEIGTGGGLYWYLAATLAAFVGGLAEAGAALLRTASRPSV